MCGTALTLPPELYTKIKILQTLDDRKFQNARPITANVHLVNPISGSTYPEVFCVGKGK